MNSCGSCCCRIRRAKNGSKFYPLENLPTVLHFGTFATKKMKIRLKLGAFYYKLRIANHQYNKNSTQAQRASNLNPNNWTLGNGSIPSVPYYMTESWCINHIYLSTNKSKTQLVDENSMAWVREKLQSPMHPYKTYLKTIQVFSKVAKHELLRMFMDISNMNMVYQLSHEIS